MGREELGALEGLGPCRVARQLKSEMQTSVEVMLLEPGRLDPGRPGDFSLKATEAGKVSSGRRSACGAKGLEKPQMVSSLGQVPGQVLGPASTHQFLTVVARQVLLTDLHQAPERLLWVRDT